MLKDINMFIRKHQFSDYIGGDRLVDSVSFFSPLQAHDSLTSEIGANFNTSMIRLVRIKVTFDQLANFANYLR